MPWCVLLAEWSAKNVTILEVRSRALLRQKFVHDFVVGQARGLLRAHWPGLDFTEAGECAGRRPRACPTSRILPRGASLRSGGRRQSHYRPRRGRSRDPLIVFVGERALKIRLQLRRTAA